MLDLLSFGPTVPRQTVVVIIVVGRVVVRVWLSRVREVGGLADVCAEILQRTGWMWH